MNEPKFGITSLTGCLYNSFSKLHDTKEEAFKEAERLARKERHIFFVLKVVGFVEPLEIPVKRTILEHDIDIHDGSECPPAHVLHPA